jgi:Fe2+ or Zn2+ uptake regulation protein
LETICQHSGIQERFEIFLDDHGYRSTYVRKKLLEAVIAMKGTFSVEEITENMISDRTAITLASVYNNIKLLSLFGAVTKIVVNDPVNGLVWKYRPTLDKFTEN